MDTFVSFFSKMFFVMIYGKYYLFYFLLCGTLYTRGDFYAKKSKILVRVYL